MDKVLKLLIGFDGSVSSEIALAELKRAGMPRSVEALVLSIADVIPPADAEVVDQPEADWLVAVLEKVGRRAAEAVEHAHAVALRGSMTLQAAFPHWKVRAESCADSRPSVFTRSASASFASCRVGRRMLRRFPSTMTRACQTRSPLRNLIRRTDISHLLLSHGT